MAHLKQKGYVCPGSLYPDCFSRNVKYSKEVRLNQCISVFVGEGGSGLRRESFFSFCLK